jgi:NADH:ubiquinone reductase (H+-translocating)
MARVGRNHAVAQIGPLRLSGFVGWLVWLLVHIVRTAELQTRASVLLSWISGYLFADRPVRLITGPRRDSPVASPKSPVPPVPARSRGLDPEPPERAAPWRTDSDT